MTQIPDITPALKGGIVGVLAFIICGLVIVIGFLLKHHPTVGAIKGGLPREPLSGEKPTDYWQQVCEDIEREGNNALLQVLSEHHRDITGQLDKIRTRLRESNQAAAVSAIKDFRARYDQDMIAIAKMLRAIEQRLEDR